MPILGSVIGAGTSILGGILGSSAASKAAKQQQAAGNAVAGQIEKSTGDAIKAGYDGITQSNSAITGGRDAARGYVADAGTATKGIYGDMTSGLGAYRDAGAYGLDKLKSTAGTFSFDPKNLENDPGYQFQLQQGMKALNNSAASRGMLQSGANLKAAMNYNQGLAGTAYQNAYQRALSTYGTNQQGFQSLANMGANANSQAIQAGGIYGGQLTSLAGLGANVEQNAAGLLSNTAMQGNQYIGDMGLRGTMAAGDARMGGANAAAAGTVGSANAWTSALNGVGGAAVNLGNMQSLSNMKAGSGTTGTRPFTPPTQSVYSPWAAPIPSATPIPLSNLVLPGAA